MKRSICLLILLTIGAPTLYGQDLPYAWNFTVQPVTASVGSTYATTGSTLDNSGNLFLIGNFTGTCDFDPSPATSNLTSSGQDIFFAKYTSQGQLIGTPKKIGGTATDAAGNIFYDNGSGFIYLTGSFSGTADFNPGGAVNNLVSAGGTDAFIAGYDTDGNYLGAYAIGGTGADVGNLVRVYLGDVYLIGTYSGTADFDPVGTSNQIAVGNSDIFIARYTITPSLVWVKSIGSTNFDFPGSFRLADNAIYLSALVAGALVDFDPGLGTANIMGVNGTTDLALAKYDLSGNLSWAKSIGGLGSQSGDLYIANGTDLYVAGGFEQTTDLDPGTGITSATSLSGHDAFLCRINTSGDLVWSKTWTSPGTTSASIQQVLSDNTLLVTGSFNGSIDLDPGVGVFNQTSNGLADGFFLRMNTTGNFLDGFAMGGPLADLTPGAISNGIAKIFMSAQYATTVDLDPSAEVNGVATTPSAAQLFATSYSFIANEPTAQPTGLTFNTITANSFNFSFTAAAGNPAGYLVVRRPVASPTGIPKDGKQYYEGEAVGDGYVVQSSGAASGTSLLMVANTNYHFDVFSFNGAGDSTNYFITSPLQGSDTTSAITYNRYYDSIALVNFYNSTLGIGWTNRTNWTTGTIDTWFGVTVSANRVTAINLANNNLIGQIPPTIGNLTALQSLDLGTNFISRSIPTELGNIISLTNITLAANQLSGDIPPSLGNLVNLTILNLDRNLLTGSIPSSLGNLSNLTDLYLSENQLSGSIPGELGNLTLLVNLYLYINKLSGSIPNELSNLSSIIDLDISYNQLTGAIPSQIGNLTSLQYLFLNGNKLSGSIPIELGNLINLEVLILHTNDLTGSIPAELGNLTNLVDLRISATKVSGAIPSSLGNLTNLSILYLGLNKELTGAVPASFSNLTSLTQLDVQDNKLDSLPNLSALPLLTVLVVKNNRFTFEDLEPNISKLGSSTNYNPQAVFGALGNQSIVTGQPLNLSFTVGGTSNIYQWKKAAVNVGTNSNSFNIPSTILSDAATYTLTITNGIVPGITLTSFSQIVSVKSEGLFEWISNAGDLTAEGLQPSISISTDQNYSGQWGDYDNDGFEDVFIAGIATQERSYLYKNNGNGTFTKAPSNSYFYSAGRSVAWADYDNDGFLDFFAPGGGFAPDSAAASFIFRNNGNETFTKVPLPNSPINTAGTWADTDNDGDVDLILNGGSGFVSLYRNDGGNTFTFLPNFSTNPNSQWPIMLVDLNNDNKMDVYIPDDTQRNLYFATGNSTFALNTTSPLVTDALTSQRGASFADIDNDGDMDAYLMAGSVGHAFYINNGSGVFTQQTTLAILGETIFGGRGSSFADFNNDGYVDLLTTQTNIPPAGWHLYLNNGNGTFTRQSNQSFKSGATFSGASFGDYNNDGFLDIVSASFGADYNGLYRNVGNSNNWLQVKLTGVVSNHSAIGAKVSVKAGGFWRHHQILTTNGFGNQNSLIAQFGLGGSATADSIKIQWPSGYQQVVLNVAGNQRTTITEVNLDSTALVAFYNATNGASWITKTNWLTGPIATWYGITVKNNRVCKIQIATNNITGTIPAAFGNLTALDTLILAGNNITGAVPVEFGNLSSLKLIDLSANLLVDLPNLTSLTATANLDVSGNQLTFEDLESNTSIPGIVYSPQRLITSVGDFSALFGNPINLQYVIGGSSNVYQWYKDSATVGTNSNAYLISSMTLGDEGTYYLTITNSLVPGLTLQTGNSIVALTKQFFWIGDGGDWNDLNHWSLTSGAVNPPGVLPTISDNVFFDANSFTQPGEIVYVVDDGSTIGVAFKTMDWRGVTNNPTFQIKAVTSQWIGNDCGGSIYFDDNMTLDFDSVEFYMASSVNYEFDTKGHHLGGNCWLWFNSQFPVTCNILSDINHAWTYLNKGTVNFNGHSFLGINTTYPAIWLAAAGATVNITNSNVDIGTLTLVAGSTLIDDNSTLTIRTNFNASNQNLNNVKFASVSMSPASANNTFATLEILPGSTVVLPSSSTQTVINFIANGTRQDTITINATSAGVPATIQKTSGVLNAYYVHLKDNTATGGANFKAHGSWNEGNVTGWNFKIDPLDSLALTSLFNSTNGPNWSNSTNWNGPVNARAGINVTNSRVTDISLPNNQLNGTIPPAFIDLTALTSLDLSVNQLSGAFPLVLADPNLSNLTSINLGGNLLTGVIPTQIGDMTNLSNLNLSDNQFNGSVPSEITQLTGLTDLDLSGNEIASLPDLTGMPSLTTVDVSSNNLDFASLEANASLTGSVEYLNQDSVSLPSYNEIPVNTDTTMTIPVGGTSNIYQWKFKGRTDIDYNVISGAVSDSYTLASINRTTMGDYILEITNPLVPGLALTSSKHRVFATADIAGTLFENNNQAAEEGKMRLLKVTQTGSYDTIDVQDVASNGAYLFDNVLLEDYLVNGYADTLLYAKALPTYFEKTIFWEEADTLVLEDNIAALDIHSEFKPDPPTTGQGEITGTFYENVGGRTSAKTRVSNSPVTVRRVQGGGRGKEEVLTLIAHTFTDDNGEFVFTKLDEAEYRLNIQLPGYPMDPNSFITIPIVDNLFERQVGVEAEVIDGKIEVRKLVITGWQQETHSVEAYPNPTVDYLYIGGSGSDKNTTLRLHDSSGKIVSVNTTWNQLDQRWELNIKELQAGVYILQVHTNGKTEALQIIIQ